MLPIIKHSWASQDQETERKPFANATATKCNFVAHVRACVRACVRASKSLVCCLDHPDRIHNHDAYCWLTHNVLVSGREVHEPHRPLHHPPTVTHRSTETQRNTVTHSDTGTVTGKNAPAILLVGQVFVQWREPHRRESRFVTQCGKQTWFIIGLPFRGSNFVSHCFRVAVMCFLPFRQRLADVKCLLTVNWSRTLLSVLKRLWKKRAFPSGVQPQIEVEHVAASAQHANKQIECWREGKRFLHPLCDGCHLSCHIGRPSFSCS